MRNSYDLIRSFREDCEKLEVAGIQPFVNAYTDVAHVVRRMFTTPFARHENGTDFLNSCLENEVDFTTDQAFLNYYDFLDLTMEYGNADALTLELQHGEIFFLKW